MEQTLVDADRRADRWYSRGGVLKQLVAAFGPFVCAVAEWHDPDVPVCDRPGRVRVPPPFGRELGEFRSDRATAADHAQASPGTTVHLLQRFGDVDQEVLGRRRPNPPDHGAAVGDLPVGSDPVVVGFDARRDDPNVGAMLKRPVGEDLVPGDHAIGAGRTTSCEKRPREGTLPPTTEIRQAPVVPGQPVVDVVDAQRGALQKTGLIAPTRQSLGVANQQEVRRGRNRALCVPGAVDDHVITIDPAGADEPVDPVQSPGSNRAVGGRIRHDHMVRGHRCATASQSANQPFMERHATVRRCRSMSR